MRSLHSVFLSGNDAAAQQRARFQATDFMRVRGTAKPPLPPRDIQIQSGPRGMFVTWKLPGLKNKDIVGWRVYKSDESTLYQDIRDRGTRQCFVESTAGTTPPVTNIFVSAINALGVESSKVQAQGSATAESGAPTMPAPPPGYNDESSGGGDQTAGVGRQQFLV